MHSSATIPTLQVPRAAIFDLLTSQNDRHAQNLFINPDGTLSLIDNERAFYENQHFAIDSILLPTTKKYTINVMENSWIHKFANWGDKVCEKASQVSMFMVDMPLAWAYPLATSCMKLSMWHGAQLCHALCLLFHPDCPTPLAIRLPCFCRACLPTSHDMPVKHVLLFDQARATMHAPCTMRLELQPVLLVKSMPCHFAVFAHCNFLLQKPQAWANVALLFDYRCYIEGGKIGKDYPPSVQQCLTKLHGMSTEEVQVWESRRKISI